MSLKRVHFQFEIYSQGGEGGKTVPLKEGVVNDIKIEVTAEDGTVRNYFVHIRRLSAKDATLSNIKLNIGKLTPEFSADVTQYYSKNFVYCNCNMSSTFHEKTFFLRRQFQQLL